MGGMPQEKIEYGTLQLQCALAVQSLLSFQTLEMPGEHARGIFRVRLETGTDPEKFARSLQDIPVVLQIKGAEGITNTIPLFSGYPEEIRLFTYGEYQEAEITVLSGTVLLDRKRRNRVFQTLGQKYGDILGRVLRDTPNAAYIMTVQDSGTGVPFFQYEETDWEFLARVTSRLGLALVADTSHHYPRFYVGLRRGSAREIPEESIMAVSFDGVRFYEMERKGVQVAREDFFCYHVTTWTNLELGERVQVKGRMLSVNRKEMILQDGEVVFRYCLAGESYALTAERQNADMIGITLYGEVQGTEGELCELTLDLESGQGGGYQYPFAPETGNLMYCMPQPGTKVCLSLGSGEESESLVSGCIRGNGAECEGTSDPSKRSFHTEYDKGLELYPDRMGLTGGTIGGLLLDDLTGTSLTSAASLVLYASGNIILDSEGILGLGALSGIFGGTGQEGCFCINDRFDYLASSALLKGCDYLRYDPFDDAPRQGEFDWGGFWRNIAIGVAVVAVAAIAAAAVLATGGGAAVVFAAGAAVGPQMAFGACVGAAIGAAATTASIAIEDFNDGDVRSWEEATLTIVASAISGAITGAIGARFPHMNKFLAGLIDTGLSTLERAVVGWFTLDMTTEEYLAYVFDWRQIALDYVIGVGIDFLVDGIADRFRPEVTYSGLGGEFADNIGDGITREMRETMEDTMEEGLERTVRETTEETAERSARDMPGPARYGDRKISDELYSELRSQTPSQNIRDKVNKNIDELIGTPDPALPNKIIDRRLEADHIVPMDRITRMEGFEKLTFDQQLKTLNYEDNFIGLSKAANASKGKKLFSEWFIYKKENLPINKEFRRLMIEREKELERILQQMIDSFLGL